MKKRYWHITCVFIAGYLLGGCERSSVSPEGCDPSLPATGEKRLVAHPKKPSGCFVVVMQCNACVYDAEGTLQGVETETCGVCLGADF